MPLVNWTGTRDPDTDYRIPHIGGGLVARRPQRIGAGSQNGLRAVGDWGLAVGASYAGTIVHDDGGSDLRASDVEGEYWSC